MSDIINSDNPEAESSIPGKVCSVEPVAVAIPIDEIELKRPIITPTTRVTILISVMYCLMYLDRVNLSMAAKDMMLDLSITNTQLGIAFSAFFWPYTIGQLLGGWFAKQIGARLTLILCAGLVVVTTIATGFITGLMTLMAIRFGLGCGEGPAWAGATSAMSHWYNAKKFGFIQGVTHSAARLGGAVAPPIVAVVMAYFSWRVSFIFCGILTAVWVIAWANFFRDDPRTHPQITRKELEELPPPCKATKHTRVPVWALAKRIAPVWVCQFCYGCGIWLFVSWLPLYFMNQHHVDLKSSALLSSLTFAAGIFGDTLGGMLSDWVYTKTGNKRLARNLLLCVFLVSAALLLYATMLTHNITLVTILMGLAFFFLECNVGTMWAVPMDITRDFAGIAAGMMNSATGLAGIITPPIIGLLIDKTGNWDNPFILIVIMLALGGVMALFLRPDKPLVWTHEEHATEKTA